MNRSFVFAICLCVLASNNIAQNVSPKDASAVASNFLKGKGKQADSVALVFQKSDQKANPYYYVFDYQDGFVIVSGDYAAEPILGYSTEGKFRVPKGPADTIIGNNFWGWMRHYEEQFDTLRMYKLPASKATSDQWAQLLAGNFKSSSKTVGPLLTTKWGQGWPYNAMCPVDTYGPGGHTLVGCVGTAMAQIMNYHNWPPKGYGEIQYKYNGADTLSVNFNSLDFSWTSVPDSGFSSDTLEARISFGASASVGSKFGGYQTGVLFHVQSDGQNVMNRLPMEIAFASNFGYDIDSVRAYLKYSDPVWDSIIVHNIDQSRPVYYRGGDSPGHAWVCDGYDTNRYFHFNFGWNGLYDGYFSVSSISPGSFNFESMQIIVAGICPDSQVNIIGTDTILSGTNLVWDDIIISRGATLSLLPGTSILASEKSKIHCFGKLISEGHQYSRNEFSAIDTNAGWEGINFYEDYIWGYNMLSQECSKFVNTDITHSNGSGIEITGSWPPPCIIVDSCSFAYNYSSAFFCRLNSLIELKNSIFFEGGNPSRWADVFVGPGQILVKNNIFNGSKVEIQNHGDFKFVGNTLQNNSRLRTNGTNSGIYCNNIFYSNESAVEIIAAGGTFINNLFVDNHNAITTLFSKGTKLLNNTFANNYQGIALGESIQRDSIINCIINNDNPTYNAFDIRMDNSANAFVSNCLLTYGLNSIQNNTPYTLSHFCIDSIFDGSPFFIADSSSFGNNTGGFDPGHWAINSRSAAIDLGKKYQFPLGVDSIDIIGNPRIVGRIDIGAFEFQDSISKAPVIINSPQSITPCLGQLAELSVLARGDSLCYYWFHNGSPISCSGDILSIINVSASDEGYYYCIISNAYGSDTSQTAQIDPSVLIDPILTDISGPDTVVWWQKGINFSTNYYASTQYIWDILGETFETTLNSTLYNPSDTATSGAISVSSLSQCGLADTITRPLLIVPFPYNTAFAVLEGPSVVFRGEQEVTYFLNTGNYEIERQYSGPIGFDWVMENAAIWYNVSVTAPPTGIMRARWAKYSPASGNEYYGPYIEVPITVVDTVTLLPKIEGSDSILAIPDTVTYWIDSLEPATTYEWIWPAGLTPLGATDQAEISFIVGSDFNNGRISVRGVNPNWRGRYYEKSIYRNTCSPVAAIIVNGSTELCVGEYTPMNAYWPENAIFQWKRDGTNIQGAQGVAFIATISGAYAVEVTDTTNGCSLTSNPVFITVHPRPAANAGPNQVLSPGEQIELCASGGSGYLWNNAAQSTNCISVSPLENTYYSVTVTDDNNCSDSDTVTAFVLNGSSSLSGMLLYANNQASPLKSSHYKLDFTPLWAKEGLLDISGQYQIQGLDGGSYVLSITTDDLWGGANAIDALKIMRHFVQLDTLIGIKLQAGDVDSSGGINANDALLIAQRFVNNVNTFPAGDWCIPSHSVFIQDSTTYYDTIFALCYGDVNGSYEPSAPKASEMLTLSLSSERNLETTGGAFSYPIYIETEASLGSASLVLKWPDELKVSSIRMACDASDPLFSQHNGVLRIAWYSLSPMEVKKGDELLILSITADNLINNFIPELSPESAISDAEGKEIRAKLSVPALVQKSEDELIIYPLPSSGDISIRYQLSEGTAAVFKVFDLAGQVILEQHLSESNVKDGQILIRKGLLSAGTYIVGLSGSACQLYGKIIVL